MAKKHIKKPNQIIMSKRANVFYLEHCRVHMMDGRLVFIGDQGNKFEQYFNLPDRNTIFLMLGKGTSITDAAARRLAESNVLFAFCGSGGSPLVSAVDPIFVEPKSEYRPTEYMQAWFRIWMDDNRRREAAKRMLICRNHLTSEIWSSNAEIDHLNVGSMLVAYDPIINACETEADLLAIEGEIAKRLYRLLRDRFGKLKFIRQQGRRSEQTVEDRINALLDHGNYIAYGYAAVAINTLGISFSLPLLHGKTRRGALVFDIADMIKDALVMPAAFLHGVKGSDDQVFRSALVESCMDHEVLDIMFGFIQNECKNARQKQ